MKKIVTFFCVALALILCCSCFSQERNEKNIVNESGNCVYDNNEYLCYGEAAKYKIIGPMQIVGYTSSMYGGKIPLYISEYDNNKDIIYGGFDQIWFKESFKVLSIDNSPICGFYLEFYKDGFYSDEKVINVQTTSFNDIVTLVEEESIEYVSENEFGVCLFYFMLNDYLVEFCGYLFIDGSDAYIVSDLLSNDVNNVFYKINIYYRDLLFDILQ